MLKNITRLEHKIGERIFHLMVDQDSPVNEVKDALTHFIGFCVQVEQSAAKAKEEQEKSSCSESCSDIKEEPKPE